MDTRDGLAELLPPTDHNGPPSDLDILRERLAEEAAPIERRRDELLASVARVPAEVANEEVAGKVTDLIKLITACHKNAETTRVGRKEPFLASSRAVDGFFKGITDPLDRGKAALNAKLTLFLRRKADEERKVREAEAKRQRDEAARLQREADERAVALKSEEQLPAAVEAETVAAQATADADTAQRSADAKAADLSRTRGAWGGVSSLVTFWDFIDLDRAAIDLEALRNFIKPDAVEAALRLYIKAHFSPGHPGPQIAGVRIYENTKSRAV